MPRVSILLPCRDVAAYLPDCITSLAQQSWEDFEVIAVNDHSSDATLQILTDWAARDARVHVITAKDAGLINALNTGLAHASSDFIARMDADDIAHPKRLETQLRAFAADPVLAACGTGVRYFPRDELREGALRYEKWLNSLVEPDELERDMFVECPIAHPTLMIRAPILREVDGYEDRGWPEDYDLVLRLYLRGARMRNVPKTLLQWRERADRSSRQDVRYSEDAFRKCKAHYLIASRPEMKELIVWGAGPVGKAFARELVNKGIHVLAFIDVDPRKVGQKVGGTPVLPLGVLSSQHQDAFIVVAVSGASPRAQIREALSALGRRELTDFVAVA